jgi:hypothetical protein
VRLDRLAVLMSDLCSDAGARSRRLVRETSRGSGLLQPSRTGPMSGPAVVWPGACWIGSSVHRVGRVAVLHEIVAKIAPLHDSIRQPYSGGSRTSRVPPADRVGSGPGISPSGGVTSGCRDMPHLSGSGQRSAKVTRRYTDLSAKDRGQMALVSEADFLRD